jgi:hypothetical protein
MIWAGSCGTNGERRGAYRVSVGKPEEGELGDLVVNGSINGSSRNWTGGGVDGYGSG